MLFPFLRDNFINVTFLILIQDNQWNREILRLIKFIVSNCNLKSMSNISHAPPSSGIFPKRKFIEYAGMFRDTCCIALGLTAILSCITVKVHRNISLTKPSMRQIAARTTPRKQLVVARELAETSRCSPVRFPRNYASTT